MKTPVSKNEKLTVTVEDLTYEGMGVAKVDGYPLFIAGTLPGEKVEAVVVKARKNFGFARALKWFSKSPDRVEDDAQQDGVTPLGHLKYEAQLKFKQNQIQQLLKKAHLDEQIKVLSTLGMKNPIHYRNKAQVPVRKINGQLEVGFYRKGSHHFVPMKDFTIQDQRIDEILQATLTILNRYDLSAYDEQTQKGLIRHLMVRRGYYSHEAMVVIVTNGKSFPHEDKIASEIIESMPDVKSVIQNVNNRNTNVILGNQDIVLAGASTITDTLNGLKFKISAHSFYQVNPQQTEILYNEAIKQAGLTGNETVIDAYCGIGTISLNLAEHARKVYGVEIVPEAIADAKENAQLNHIDNVDFEVGNAEEWMAKWESQGINPDVIMVDPPRKGLTNSLIHSAAAMNPKKIVYVSCNPATLVRDIQQFMDEGYHVSQPIQPVDQFPMTQHVESITVMTRS
ncbi:23S rRNA (uracil(1939)-C(5))-methyltransferase RlmD [Ligilactobacillus aviarius]|uniref:23S rRNA (uracil(1939)-C(5))-methyltransferase RlmD n=1 Tax=Ligilactobacillus aviarius TaxID=1606 RepID=UPI0024B98C2B|nr:23S rRNA (uracil(1939)-C(5))-methyltransferase RlmD [Ligilactobacillus aviarius]